MPKKYRLTSPIPATPDLAMHLNYGFWTLRLYLANRPDTSLKTIGKDFENYFYELDIQVQQPTAKSFLININLSLLDADQSRETITIARLSQSNDREICYLDLNIAPFLEFVVQDQKLYDLRPLIADQTELRNKLNNSLAQLYNKYPLLHVEQVYPSSYSYEACFANGAVNLGEVIKEEYLSNPPILEEPIVTSLPAPIYLVLHPWMLVEMLIYVFSGPWKSTEEIRIERMQEGRKRAVAQKRLHKQLLEAKSKMSSFS